MGRLSPLAADSWMTSPARRSPSPVLSRIAQRKTSACSPACIRLSRIGYLPGGRQVGLAGADVRTVAELLRNRTPHMAMRYSHSRAGLHARSRAADASEIPDSNRHHSSTGAVWRDCESELSDFFSLPCPGGGMADAGDLKSPALTGACGFDSHPGHQRTLEGKKGKDKSLEEARFNPDSPPPLLAIPEKSLRITDRLS